jgi:hypothetical protein
MVNLALDWQQATALTVVLFILTLSATGLRIPWLRRVAPWALEATIISGLYALWQLAGTLSVLGTAGAFRRAREILRLERDWHLPSELSVQRLVLGRRGLVEAANLYYATMHFAVIAGFLVWLFVKHRDRYPGIRTTLAVSTFLCLAIQLIPVAPPRLLPGFTDTATLYGQSVYSLGIDPDQLSAMPSVHVAWAVLVGWYVARLGTGPWRWSGAAHAVLTVFVVVATANHFWLDGIVGVAVLAAVANLGVLYARVRRPDASRVLSAPVEATMLQ